MKPFDLLGPLPETNSTTVLEASAGTGKTFVLAALVTRYVAEGVATLDDMLLITFSRAATRELRERVRAQLLEAADALDRGTAFPGNEVIVHLLDAEPEAVALRARRLRHALANFDAATIATTHQFCQIVLRSLGVAGDTDPEVTLVDSLDDLVTEIADDVYLAQFGNSPDPPRFPRAEALKLARAAVEHPATKIRPVDPPAGTAAAARVEFVDRVLEQLEPRKRNRRVQGFDDLLVRLAAALEGDDAPARIRMRTRWSIVMVDEFQDTDPVQWQVIDRAFSGAATLVLIGDPKQAIYAFRGGDIVTYLQAARTAGDRRTLAENWRTDKPMLDAVHTVLRGAALGDPDIVVGDVAAAHPSHRLAGAPHNEPFRLRVVSREQFRRKPHEDIPIADLRTHIANDLAADVARLLKAGATFAGEKLKASDIAVIVDSWREAVPCRDALAAVGIGAVYCGDSDVFASPAADDWLRLIEAMEQTHRPALVRAAALTAFFGETGESLAHGGDVRTDEIAETLRDWADRARRHGVAAVFESANLAGMGRRVLATPGGARRLTDLAHLADLLQEVALRDGLSLPALAELLRGHRSTEDVGVQRNRRLDSEASAVQIMTYWGSKGLQFPVVYLPSLFNRNIQVGDHQTFHDADGNRCLHVGGTSSPDAVEATARALAENAGETLRFGYVALTRAQSQVIAWWAPSHDEVNGALSRLLRGRGPGESAVPDKCESGIGDEEALHCFRSWEQAGGPVLERSVIAPTAMLPQEKPPAGLAVRKLTRSVDTEWRRTSYSGLVRAAEDRGPGVGSEPEVGGKDDEVEAVQTVPTDSVGGEVLSPMTDLPGGATFGSLVHAVLETADPRADDLAAELAAQIDRHLPWWPVDAPTDVIAAALVPLHDTPLGPLAPGRTLRNITPADRLCELDFEIPLAGGDLIHDARDVTVSQLGDLLAEQLPAGDPMAAYADQLRAPALGAQSLRGYLSGSIDAVLRIDDPAVGHRYLVVDYKTNRLGDSQRPATAADYAMPQLVGAMLHSDYTLQALLYSVVLHRFLRWRIPDYRPEDHLGGVLYLFLRGMCGADTPLVDGHPSGVFSWKPPAALVTALSDLLDGQEVRR